MLNTLCLIHNLNTPIYYFRHLHLRKKKLHIYFYLTCLHFFNKHTHTLHSVNIADQHILANENYFMRWVLLLYVTYLTSQILGSEFQMFI